MKLSSHMNYSLVFITSSFSFYKVNLFNELSMRKKIMVFCLGIDGSKRSPDFYNSKLDCDCIVLPSNYILAILMVLKFFISNSYQEVVLGGWDSLVGWLICLFSPKRKNSCIFESSICESEVLGVKGKMKRFFLKRLHKAYPSGELQTELLLKLEFEGQIVKYGGCGILNYQPQPPYERRSEVKKFLYVGRLAPEKNIELLIEVFSLFPDLHLTIIGEGESELKLKRMSATLSNVTFLGAIENIKLPFFYKEADVFILPSKSEPWGLVVEEALNNGTPVIVSDKVGCSKDLVSSQTGVIFESENRDSLISSIIQICDIQKYNELRKGVSLMDFSERARRQVESFLLE